MCAVWLCVGLLLDVGRWASGVGLWCEPLCLVVGGGLCWGWGGRWCWRGAFTHTHTHTHIEWLPKTPKPHFKFNY